MHVLLLLKVLEYRLEHVLRVGYLLGALVADMAHAGLDERRLELFIVAVLHVPQHDRRKAVFLFEALQRRLIHAAGRDKDHSARFAGILLHIYLRHHTAVARADEDGSLYPKRLEESMHSGDERLICRQLLRIVKEQHAVIPGKGVHIVHPHFKRVHPAV